MWSSTKEWLLQRAAAPEGFTPNETGTVSLLRQLEMDRLVRQSENYPVWMITEEGRAEIERLNQQSLSQEPK